MGIKLTLLEYLAEIPPAVAKLLGLDNPNALNVLFDEIHALTVVDEFIGKVNHFSTSMQDYSRKSSTFAARLSINTQ